MTDASTWERRAYILDHRVLAFCDWSCRLIRLTALQPKILATCPHARLIRLYERDNSIDSSGQPFERRNTPVASGQLTTQYILVSQHSLDHPVAKVIRAFAATYRHGALNPTVGGQVVSLRRKGTVFLLRLVGQQLLAVSLTVL